MLTGVAQIITAAHRLVILHAQPTNEPWSQIKNK